MIEKTFRKLPSREADLERTYIELYHNEHWEIYLYKKKIKIYYISEDKVGHDTIKEKTLYIFDREKEKKEILELIPGSAWDYLSDTYPDFSEFEEKIEEEE